MKYRLSGHCQLDRSDEPRATRKEALRYDEETDRPYKDYNKHIDVERTVWNNVLVNRNVREVYKNMLSEAVNAYNARMLAEGRPSRCKTVEGYMKQIEDGEKKGNAKSRPKLWSSAVVQCGNQVDNEAWIPMRGKKVQPALALLSNEVYKEFLQRFEERYPNLIVTLAVIHNDEATPHMQMHFIPFCHSNKSGLPVQVKLGDGLAEALDRLGIRYGSIKSDNVKKAFNEDVDGLLADVMRSHGIEWIPPKKDDNDLTGEQKRRRKKERQDVNQLRKEQRLLTELIEKGVEEATVTLDNIDRLNIPFKGVYFSENDVRAIVNNKMKQMALLQEYYDNGKVLEQRNKELLKSQQKRFEYEMSKRELEIGRREKEAASALRDAELLKKKLEKSDEQKRYAVLNESVRKKESELNQKLQEAQLMIDKSRSDADKLRKAAVRDADKIVADAHRNVDVVYAEYLSSDTGRKMRDEVKLRLLSERYPDIDGRLDAEAGHELLKRHRSRARENGDRER